MPFRDRRTRGPPQRHSIHPRRRPRANARVYRTRRWTGANGKTRTAQRWLQSRALQISGDVTATRWLLTVQVGTAIPKAFLVVLVFWLTIIFVSFGLFAPRNATAVVALLICALSVAGSIFPIVEMGQPFRGLIHVSSAPMRDALAELGQPR